MNDRVYDALSRVVKLLLPAIGTFYAAIASIWTLPYSVEVVGSLAALATLGGVLLAVSKKNYLANDERFDGHLVVDTTDPNKDKYVLNIQTPLEDLQNKSEVSLKVAGLDQGAGK